MSIVGALKDPRDPTARDEFRNFFKYNPELLRKKPEELSQKVQAGLALFRVSRLCATGDKIFVPNRTTVPHWAYTGRPF
jgi:hypothetical protein